MAQKLRRPSAFLALGCILFGAILVFFPYGSALPMIISLGIIGGIPAGSIIALPATVLSPKSRSIGMGLFYSIHYGIMTVMPGLAGLVLDLTKSTASPFFFGAGLLFISILVLIWFRSIQKPLRMKREQS